MTMRMRIIMVLGLALSLSGFAHAQSQVANLTAQDSSCTVTDSGCVISNLPINAATTTLQLSGTFSGTVQFEVTSSGDPTSAIWVSVNATPSNGVTPATSATAAGIWTVPASGYQKIRIRCSSYVSGTIVARINIGTYGGRN